MLETKQSVFYLGSCRIDVSDNSLLFPATAERAQERITLQPKFVEVLAYLAHQFPRVVTREALITDIWEGNTYVGEKALTNAIWHLRQQLGPLGAGEVIETVRKTGYRLCIEPRFELAAEDGHLRLERKSRLLGRALLGCSIVLALVLVAAGHHWYEDTLHRPFGVDRLTSDGGSERFPGVSPDGRFLVYGGQQPGKNGSLFQLDLDHPDASPRQLTPDSSDELRAVWSNDGKSLYFPSVSAGSCKITRLDLKDGQLTPLADCNSVTSAIELSADGNTLAFITTNAPQRNAGIYLLDLSQENALPVRLSCDTDCPHRDRDFAFSPDGQTLAIARRFGDISEDIFLRQLADGSERRLTQGIEDIRGLSWHRDGRRLVYSTEEAGNRGGYLIDTESGDITALDLEGLSYPRFVPDSDELVFYHYNNHRQLVSMHPFAEVPQAPFPMIYGNFSQRYADYSPQAGRLVFVSNESGHNEIWTSDVDGQRRQMHTSLKRQATSPAWSHDGSRIAFVAADTNHEGNKLHILDIRDNSIRIVASPYINHGRPEWSGDDSFLLASTVDGLTRFHLDNKPPVLVSPIMVRRLQVVGDWLYFSYSTGPRGLWRMPWQGGESELVLGGKLMSDGYNWTLAERGVFFRQRHSSSALLSYYDFAQAQVRPLIELPPNSISRQENMVWVENEQKLVLVSWNYPRRDVMRLRHPALQ
ncbi:winged helix-turn-helix domain-containing protein [Shewanella litorisediminis]|uniref:PD40 domain-containing protein n=1 Tax=Shewanella litorisediminis TaxID=1173586 RepID=A0ABX7G5J3_9GAMM|nr:winged helix-turn-helix domain-containing protein [Shewanella litorisediminis]MCL2917464.1 winged helix-turn-helix domain-containing protein [Shewanella litorisediminis]QRH02595.1 PD40 domain-containing protein [Shewanella litorisediminis]